MKKFLFLVLSCLCFTACHEEVKYTKGIVKDLSLTQLVLGIGDHDITIDISESTQSNGYVTFNDSVTVFYVGELKGNQAKAVDISLIPAPAMYLDKEFHPEAKLEVDSVSFSEDDIVSREKAFKLLEKKNHQNKED